MKFRTEITLGKYPAKIGYENRVLALGSCFADEMARRLAAAKFAVEANPTGVLFNPLSIAEAIRSYADPKEVGREELHDDGGRWFHFGFHGDFSAPTADEALARMNAARRAGAEALRRADRVLLTLGTAWVYEREGRAVANCHRQPAREFVRRRMGVDEVVGTLERLVAGPLAGRETIVTVSPVRHLGDGLEGNAVSKATLRLAAEELAAGHASVHYFPAYEMLVDDLRDYRFYADDMVHPAPQAVTYVWEQFAEALLTDAARGRLAEVEAIAAAAAHRPRDPRGAAHRAFCLRQLERIAALPEVDFSTEAAYFRRCLEINS